MGEVLAKTIVNEESGEVIALCNTELTETLLETLEAEGVNEFKILHIDGVKYSQSFSKTLALDKVKTI